MHIIFEPIFGHQLLISKGIKNVSKIIKKHEDMRTKSVSFPDPARLRSLFGPCYAYAVLSFVAVTNEVKKFWLLKPIYKSSNVRLAERSVAAYVV